MRPVRPVRVIAIAAHVVRLVNNAICQVPVLCNLAACALGSRRWTRAALLAEQAISLDPAAWKAHSRRVGLVAGWMSQGVGARVGDAWIYARDGESLKKS